MARPTGFIAAAAILGLTASVTSAQTTAGRAALMPGPQFQQAKLSLGAIRGVVLDDHGAPVSDAMVSALSPLSSRMVTTDSQGQFRIDSLPTGDYVLRVHRTGFVSTRREGVRVSANGAAADVAAIHLHRDAAPDGARPILTAGMDTPVPDPGSDGENHGETAWRLRHIKRSILKQDGSVVDVGDAATEEPAGSLFGRAFDNAASFFTGTPFSGEVNLLTTSAARDGSIMPADVVPHGVAYLSIGAPAASGRWDVRASLSQSDLSAWIVAGSFTSRAASPHVYQFGVSYAAQQYQDQHPRPTLTLSDASAGDESRTVGELYGSDHWTISPVIAIDYSARYGHYDYLDDRSLFSPRVGFTLTPYEGTHLSAHVEQRMLAPGAEEFLAPATVGPWLPPERTFEAAPGEDLRAERIRSFDVGLDHTIDGACLVGVRRFQQHVDDQFVTMFGLPLAGGPGTDGHYYIANAGALDADGWVFSVATLPTRRVHGSLDYTIARTDWLSRGDLAEIAVFAPSAIRGSVEDVHDLTGSLQTELPLTATRVLVVYKVNTAVAHADDPSRPAFDSRFDVQFNQALPFMPFSHTARWEVLVGMRNLFHDPSEAGSVYDELLVVRPPKRLVGGVQVRF